MGRLGKLLAAITTAICAANAQTPNSLTVMVYNYTDLPSGKLAEAEAIASRSYGAARVKVNWLACPSVEEDTEEFRACDRASATGSPYIRVYPESMAAGSPSLRRMDDAIGSAAGLGAIIVYPRVREMAEQWNCPEDVILGRAMAHELGHILLGDNSHSSHGLMRPHFGRKDLSAESAQYLFEPTQAAKLREAVRRGHQ
jgi:hypothetical protein